MALPVEPLEPVRRSVVVPVPPERAFVLFAGDIGRWWPLEQHSLGRERALDVTIEPRTGGLVVECIDSGAEAQWGSVLAWEPPARLVLAWHPGRGGDEPFTEVEVTFAAAAGGATLVQLAHHGWERLAVPQQARSNYLNGWPTVLDRFGEHAGAGTSASREEAAA